MSAAERAGLCAIAVMAKAPQPGRSKTRLVPPLSPEQAASLSAAFLRDTTESIAEAAQAVPIAGYAAYAPAGLEPLLAACLAAGTGFVLADGAGGEAEGVTGFGRCLLHAVRALLGQGYAAACVLSSDGPTLPSARLAQAARALLAPGSRAVLGPAEDGGYYLLGLKSPESALFADIAWSTDTVAAQTRARAAAIGLELVELAPWYDVDEKASLARLVAELDDPPDLAGGESAYHAPATRDVIARLAAPMRRSA